jgi:hypothetical protein
LITICDAHTNGTADGRILMPDADALDAAETVTA